jgi:hypothetical protein
MQSASHKVCAISKRQINHLKPKLDYTVFKHSVYTSKKTQRLHYEDKLIKIIVAVNSENNTKPINTLYRQTAELLNVK